MFPLCNHTLSWCGPFEMKLGCNFFPEQYEFDAPDLKLNNAYNTGDYIGKAARTQSAVGKAVIVLKCYFTSSSQAHCDLDEVVISKTRVAILGRVSPPELVGQSSELDAAGHKVVECDASVVTVALKDAVQRLRAQIIPHVAQGLLQFLGLHVPAPVPVVVHKRGLPLVQDARQLLKLVKAHRAGEVSVQHADHESTGLQVERVVGAGDA